MPDDAFPPRDPERERPVGNVDAARLDALDVGQAPRGALTEIAGAMADRVEERERAERAVRETRAMVLQQLRTEDGDPDLADRIEAGEPMSERDKVLVDAIIHGTGFLVDGERVSPERVKIIKWDGP